MRSNPLPESREYADLMLHELRKVIPSFLRRVDLPDRGGRWSEYFETTRTDTSALVHSLFGTHARRPRGRGRTRRLRSGGRGQDPRRDLLLRTRRCPRQQLLERVRQLGVDERVVAAAGLRRRAGESSPQAGPGVRAELLPVRRAQRLRRIPRHAAPPDAHHRMATAHPEPRLHPARSRRGGRRRRRVRRGDAAVGGAVRPAQRRLPRAGPVRRVDGVPDALRDAVQRPRGDAHARAAVVAAGPPVVPPRGARDAPPDRRTGRAPRDRRRRWRT